MTINEIFSEKKCKNKILNFFDFSEKWRFCWFFDEKLAISRKGIDLSLFQDQIWKGH
jgi:hypothetical protein